MAMLLPLLHKKESLTNGLIESKDKKMQSDEQIETQGEERGGEEGWSRGRARRARRAGRDYEQDSGGTRGKDEGTGSCKDN